MGNCTQRCPKTMENNPGVKIGESRVVPYSCGSDAFVPDIKLCPDNGEWRADKADDWCKFDSLEPGCQLTCPSGTSCGNETSTCIDKDGNMFDKDGKTGGKKGSCYLVGHCYVDGKRTMCTRENYLAPKEACCSMGTDVIVDKTCDPRYRDRSSDICRGVMTAYCTNEGNFFGDYCETWLKDLQSSEKDILAKQICPKYRSKDKPSNDSNSSEEYERRRKVCSCYNASAETTDPDLMGFYQCLDADCRNTSVAIQPTNMGDCSVINQKCIIGDISTHLENTAPGVNPQDLVDVSNKCNIYLSESAKSTPSITPGAQTETPGTETGEYSTNWIIGIIIAIILLIAVAIYYFYIKKKAV